MILAIDVHYRATFAKAVSIEFPNWEAAIPDNIKEVRIQEVAPYVPGLFYKRELPCILEVLKETNLKAVEAIIIDGYVVLDDNGKLGLGGYLYQALEGAIPIIGVAKKSFHSNGDLVKKVYRGSSKNPLYVTSMGMQVAQASTRIKEMAGDYRFPDLLRILDRHTKT